MKRYNHKVRDLRQADNKIVRFKEDMDVLISSSEFNEKFRGYIEDIALYKRANGYKFRRPMDYAAVGIMDQNDVIQEAYLAFLEAYNNIDWNKVNGEAAILWGFLKKSTILNLERQLRDKKDGIRIPEWALFSGDMNTNFLTKLFSRLEVAFSNNVMEVAESKWDTDLTGYFLEVHMDEVLDLKKSGERNLKGIERLIVRDSYGIDTVKKSSKELAEKFKISPSTIDVVRKRALDKLRTNESKQKIAHFLHEYRIKTGADIGYRRK